jgi:hypothetical protein
VVAVLQSFNFTFGERDGGFLQQGLITFSLSCGAAWRSFDPKTNAATFNWPVATTVQGSDQSTYFWNASGLFLTGDGLRASYFPGLVHGVAIPVSNVGPRPGPDAFLWGEAERYPFRSKGLAPIVRADVAFTAHGGVTNMGPNGAVRELELEFKGSHYDGQIEDWWLGVGISAQPPGQQESNYFGGALPLAGGLARAGPLAPISRPLTRDLRFDDAVPGLLQFLPAQFGAIRNPGTSRLLINQVTTSGPNVDEFGFILQLVTERFDPRDNLDFILEMLRRERAGLSLPDILNMLSAHKIFWGGLFTPYDLNNNSPLVVGPGETLLVGGLFFPQAAGPRTAAISFQAYLNFNYPIAIQAIGNTVASDARADVLPPGRVRFIYPNYQQNVLISSIGQTPLLVTHLRLANAGTWFGFMVVPPPGGFTPTGNPGYQLDPGDALLIQVVFEPQGPVTATQNTLIAETNAGQLQVELVVEDQ